MANLIADLPVVQETVLDMRVSSRTIISLIQEELMGDTQYVVFIDRPDGFPLLENIYNHRWQAKYMYRRLLRQHR